MGNQGPSTPKKRLNYLKNNPPRTQSNIQNKSTEPVSRSAILSQDPNLKTKSLSPFQKDLETKSFRAYKTIQNYQTPKKGESKQKAINIIIFF